MYRNFGGSFGTSGLPVLISLVRLRRCDGHGFYDGMDQELYINHGWM